MQRDFLLKPPRLRQIILSVAERHGLTYRDLVGPSRFRRVAWPRQEAYSKCREEGQASLPAIALAFGGRDHTTVIHGIRKHNERLAGANGADV